MPIKILINGYQGKMGQIAVKAINSTTDLEFVAGCNRQHNLQQMIHESGAEVVLDLTTASAVFENASAIIETGAHPVIGTSGLVSEQIAVLQQKCQEKKLGGIIVPNFSLGAILMMHFAEQAAHYFDDAQIIELHHPEKKDAPSGTARKTAELIQAANKQKQAAPIHSMRMPGVMAEQSVIFGALGETLSIQHRSIDRSCFMPGILLACRQVVKLNYLLYGLGSLIINS